MRRWNHIILFNIPHSSFRIFVLNIWKFLSLILLVVGMPQWCQDNEIILTYTHTHTHTHTHTRGGADKSLVRPEGKQATATKLGIFSTYSVRSSIHFFYDHMTVHRNRFLVNKTNRCTEIQFYWYYDSTCFGQLFCPSSEVLSRTSALVHFMQLWWPYATRSGYFW